MYLLQPASRSMKYTLPLQIGKAARNELPIRDAVVDTPVVSWVQATQVVRLVEEGMHGMDRSGEILPASCAMRSRHL